MTIIKSDVWQSENEWRLIWRNTKTEGKVYKCPIGEDAIANIFLGLNPTERAEELIAAAKQNFPAALILRAHNRHGDLALEFRQL